MTRILLNPDLDSPTITRTTLAAKVAALFRSRPGAWIDGMEIAQCAGCYGWRTRVSDCRRKYGMRIDNRQRRVPRATGGSYTISEYQLVEDRAAVMADRSRAVSLPPRAIPRNLPSEPQLPPDEAGR